jgi:hypothetical protein
MRAMGRAEGVVDVDVSQLGERVRHLGIVGLLLEEEADVFQQDYVSRLHGLRDVDSLRADDVIEGVHRHA